MEPLREDLGYQLINRNKFGYDAFIDIRRLSKAWDLPVKRFYDVGTNEERVAEVTFSHFPCVEIFAFEPPPDTFLRLVRRMECRPRLRRQTGNALPIWIVQPEQPNAPHAVRFPQSERTMQVSCTTIDDFGATHGLGAIDVLEIDTEGSDFDVIPGGRKLLGLGAIRFVYFEFNEILERNGVSGGALPPIAMLVRPFGYRFVATYTDRIVTEGEMPAFPTRFLRYRQRRCWGHAGEHDTV
jgi:FkbM family methyltransferase